MPDPEVTKAQPVFSGTTKSAGNSPRAQAVQPPIQQAPKNKKEEKKPLPPQFVTPPDPKTPWGKIARSFTDIRNNFILPRKVKIWAPRVAIVVISLTLIIALLPFASGLISTLLNNGVAPTPTPSPTATPTSYEPSPYANDEVILAIERKIEDLEDELRNIEFREDTLYVPNLDWNVRF